MASVAPAQGEQVPDAGARSDEGDRLIDAPDRTGHDHRSGGRPFLDEVDSGTDLPDWS